MGYKIYLKNVWIKGGDTSRYSGRRFQPYDDKTYPTKQAAEEALKKRKNRFKSVDAGMKKKGWGVVFDIRRSSPKRRSRSIYDMFQF